MLIELYFTGREEQNERRESRLLLSANGSVVLGDSLGALRDSVLRELTGEEEADGGLDLSGRDRLPVVVPGKAYGFVSELLEDIGDKGVHDGHGLGRVRARKKRGRLERTLFEIPVSGWTCLRTL